MKQLLDKILKEYLELLGEVDKADPELLQRQGDLVTLIREHIGNMRAYEDVLYARSQRMKQK
jgi:hypothetical protein